MRSKSKVTAVALILVLTITATSVALPIVSAHDPAWNVYTFAFLNLAPNPIGVGQTATVSMWLDKVPPTAYWKYGDRWEDFEVEVTKPDDSKVTLGPFNSDAIGGAHTYFTPDTTGTYYFQFFFPGQTIEGKNPPPGGWPFFVDATKIGDYYMPSNSPKVELTVQTEAVEPRPATPLPTVEYWTRPINAMNPEWACIAGDWLGVDPGYSQYNAYTLAPESGHIMWTKPIAFGGVVGGPQAEYDWNYYTGLAYETKFGGFGGGPIIMSGRLYYPAPLGTSGSGGGYECLDLRTGEVLWHTDEYNSMSYGVNYDYQSPNEFGVKSYLVRGPSFWDPIPAYEFYDPFTGKWLFSIVNASSGRAAFGPQGELMTYTLDAMNDRLILWNFSRCIMYYMGIPPIANEWTWRPQGMTMDWKYGIEWNVSTNHYVEPASQAISAIDVDTGVILAFTYQGYSPNPWIMEIGYSTEDGHEMWAVNRTAPFEGGMIAWNTLTLENTVGDGVFVEFYPEKMVWYGYDITTGNKIWGPTEPYPNAWGMYSWHARIMYGMLIANDWAGYVHAYDIHTGELEWEYFAGSAGYDSPYGIYPSEMPIFGADGKIYVAHGHGYSPPIFKGATLDCINATDGTLIWKTLQYNCRTGCAVADGYIAVYNNYDGQIYCFGRGPSATTVTATPKVTALGSSIMLEGTVADTCAGAQRLVEEGKFPMVAAVSDASQGGWMEYLYMQQPCPVDVTGVEVTLDIIDPNYNWFNIATVTSDASGTYSYLWEPEIEGEYTIIATFPGSDSYGPSWAETAVGVTAAPEEPTEPATPADVEEDVNLAIDSLTPLFLAIIAAVVVAIVIGVVNLWAIRKRT